MRRSLFVFIVLMVVMVTAEAGKIYGSLQVDGKAVAVGTKIVVKCGSKTYSAKVEKYGRYNLYVDGEGRCSLEVVGHKGASIGIISYNEATRYDFTLNRSQSGYNIQRK